MGLDINTPKGQITLEQEKRAAAIIEAAWPGSTYIHTPKGSSASIDGLIVKDSVVRAVLEAKCRLMSLQQLRGGFDNEWLVSLHKLTDGAIVADKFCVGFWGALYLVPDDKVLMIQLYSPKDSWLVPYRVDKTKTQMTVNGGECYRDNAYIKMDKATLLPKNGAVI